MSQTVEELLAQVEAERRACNYPTMHDAAERLTRAMHRISAKNYYQLAMAGVQILETETDPDNRLKVGHQSLAYAESSRDSATKSGDVVGVLYAEMLMGGHLAEPTVAVGILRSALVRAIKLEDADEPRRLQRLIMDLQLHLIRRSILEGGSTAEELKQWAATLYLNPIYREEVDRGRPETEIELLDKALESHEGVINRLRH